MQIHGHTIPIDAMSHRRYLLVHRGRVARFKGILLRGIQSGAMWPGDAAFAARVLCQFCMDPQKHLSVRLVSRLMRVTPAWCACGKRGTTYVGMDAFCDAHRANAMARRNEVCEYIEVLGDEKTAAIHASIRERDRKRAAMTKIRKTANGVSFRLSSSPPSRPHP